MFFVCAPVMCVVQKPKQHSALSPADDSFEVVLVANYKISTTTVSQLLATRNQEASILECKSAW